MKRSLTKNYYIRIDGRTVSGKSVACVRLGAPDWFLFTFNDGLAFVDNNIQTSILDNARDTMKKVAKEPVSISNIIVATKWKYDEFGQVKIRKSYTLES